MRQMQFNGVEAGAQRALGAFDEVFAHPYHVLFIHGARRVPAGTEGQRRRRDGLPRIFVRAQSLCAFPRPLRRGLAAGMSELNAELGLADALAMQNDADERVLAGVRVDAEAAMGDAAVPLDMGRFEHEQAGTEFASMPRWVMCQSSATPSLALYWHIGDTAMRFDSSRSPSLIGENKALDIVCPSTGWESF